MKPIGLTQVPLAIIEEMNALNGKVSSAYHRDRRYKHAKLMHLMGDYRSAIIADLLELRRINERLAV